MYSVCIGAAYAHFFIIMHTIYQEIFCGENNNMFRQPSLLKLLGISVLSFGLGVLLAFFLPAYFLVVIEAIVIVASGILYILQKH